MMFVVTRLALYFLTSYILVIIAMYAMQRSMQYHPDRRYPGTPQDNGLIQQVEEVTIKTEDNLELLSWYAPPRKQGGKVIVFFHGNAGHIGDRSTKAQHWIEKGFGVFMLEYRGFGSNPGHPSEKGFYRDARAAIDWLEKRNLKREQFILYGESIGSGPAVQLATEIQPLALVLEAPFDSATSVGKTLYPWLPVEAILKDKYENIKKIADVQSALLIVHGDEDDVIPPELSHDLFEAANHPKDYISINGGGHNDLYEYHAGFVITDWLNGVE